MIHLNNVLSNSAGGSIVYGVPFNEIDITPPDAGTRTSGASYAQQTLRITNPTDMYYYWNGYSAYIQPTFNHTNNSYYFLLRWQDEIFRLRSRWSARGFWNWADFKAAYDPSTTGYPQAYLYQQDPSTSPNALVVFNADGAESYKWIMAHEFGHFFQYRMQNALLCCGGIHYITQQSNPATAFSEGFADWHGNANETDGRQYYYYWCTASECGPNPGLYGYTVEANVAAYFWISSTATTTRTPTAESTTCSTPTARSSTPGRRIRTTTASTRSTTTSTTKGSGRSSRARRR